ncbi:MAG: insulinase family protein, partial [Polynucleobacter sp.]|nr:insulinase family protein [Polynucleobacter sp.]
MSQILCMLKIKKFILQAVGAVAILFAGSAHALLPIETLDSVKGAKAYLIQTKSLPIIDVEVSIDAG